MLEQDHEYRFHHPRTWFPVILIGLSLTLVLVIAVFVSPEKAQEQTAGTFIEAVPEEPAVTNEDYEREASVIMKEYLENYEAAENDVQRSKIVDKAIEDLLSLKVTADRREVHFEFVSSLYMLQAGLSGDAESLAKATERLDALTTQNPWLR